MGCPGSIRERGRSRTTSLRTAWPGDEFNDFSVYYKSASGEMFFGGVNGVTAFYPEKVVDSPFVPPVVLTDFRLFNDPVPVGGRSPLKKSISYSDSLTLSHAQSIFSLEFSALSFTSPTRTRYRYRLEGLDKEWNETDSSRRMATYTTLTPRKYVFHVQGSDNHGVWNEQGVALHLQILPPWWGTWWFRTVCAVVFLALLWAAYQFRIRQLQRDFKKLRDVIETIPAMAWTARPDGSNEFVNRRWAEYTGLSAEDTAGSGWTAAVHPDDRQPYWEKWRASLATGEPLRIRGALSLRGQWGISLAFGSWCASAR